MKKLYLIIILSLVSLVSRSQSGIETPNYVPASPNASGLIKSGEYPVSHHTGVPDISIPLHTIALKDISIPMSLSYNSSGIKTEEESSRVGLGWTLNAGGVITHTIMGRFNDFYEGAYFNSYTENDLKDLTGLTYIHKYTLGSYNSELPFGPLTGMSKFQLWDGLSSDLYECGGSDLAPDVFNYNFMGYSGKFIFSHSGHIIKEKEDNLQIIPTQSANGKLQSWTITTPDGTKYYFNQTEVTEVPKSLYDNPFYNSSFYLTSIVTINGTTVNFSYEKKGHLLGTYNRTQANVVTDFSINYAMHEVVYLNQITYPNGSMTFSHNFDREDYRPEPRLTTININEGVSSTSWVMEHGYFTANAEEIDNPSVSRLKSLIQNKVSYYDDNWNRKRLKLTGIKHQSRDDRYSYKFKYNESELPTKLTTALDHWGYYNGARNAYLIPTFYQNVSMVEGTYDIRMSGYGANREPSGLHNQAFILTEIEYPTGGKTRFGYETNKYQRNNFENDTFKRDFMVSHETYVIEEPPQFNNVSTEFVNTITFDIPNNSESSRGTVDINIKMIVEDTYNSRNHTDPFMKIELEDYSGTAWQYTFRAPELPSKVDDKNRTFQLSKENIRLKPGKCHLKVYGTMRKYNRTIKVTATRPIYPTEFLLNNPVGLGGGLRIKEICHYDTNENFLSAKKFIYTTNGSEDEKASSGKLMFYPRYRSSWNTLSSNGVRGGGYSVGYSTVYVSDINASGEPFGQTVYEYVNRPDRNLYYTWEDKTVAVGSRMKAKDENPPGIPGYKYAENGTLIRETIKKYQNRRFSTIKDTQFIYRYAGSDSRIVWGILKSDMIEYGASSCLRTANPEYINSLPATDIAFGYLYPAIRPIQPQLIQTIETVNDGEKPIKTTTDYEYNSLNYLKKETRKNSDGVSSVTEYIYPTDNPEDATMKLLVSTNRIKTPVETKIHRNGTLHHTRNTYALFGGQPRLASVSVNTGAGGDFETRIQYHQYDDYGNPLYITQDGATHMVYLWGYKGQYPVAQIVNATYADVGKALGNTSVENISRQDTPDFTLLDNLRTSTVLKNAHISTYRYLPRVGVTVITTPNEMVNKYDYDSFARTRQVSYSEGSSTRVLEEYKYKYLNNQ